MEVFVYSDGVGGVFAFSSLSDFLRSRGDDLDVSERTLRGHFAASDCYVVSSVANRWVRRVEVIKMERKKVRPKYLFGKEY